jgi:hypothetical protein
MKSTGLIVVGLIFALVSMACGLQINLPRIDLKTGPTVTEDLFVPQTDEDAVQDIELNFAAGELNLAPGAQEGLIEGVATYNVPDLQPEIRTGNTIEIQTGDLEISGIPRFGGDLKNEWDLKFNTNPINLQISAGAYQGRMELGGLALHSLRVTDGAADVLLSFSEPNLVEMENLRYETGASKVELTGLANANFESMNFRGGAGEYTLDFSGELQQDASVDVDAGVSSMTIIVPEDTNVTVFVAGGLTDVNRSGAWDRQNDEYSLSGSGPSLTINVSMGAGSLNLRTR